MTWQTNPTVIRLRGLARHLGVTRILGRFLARDSYEEAFDDALFAAIQPGDIVWDVGANVGHYTQKFAEAVGEDGQVFAFEPFPSTLARLNAGLAEPADVPRGKIVAHAVALGAEAGTLTMQGGTDDLAATSRILEGGAGDDADTAGSGEISGIEMQTADAMVADARAAVPNVVKIDTEGFELDVLQGMGTVLAEPALRGVFVEVHFGLLANRGMADAPSTIQALLRAAGFETTWVDPSHIAGTRPKAA